MKDFDLTDIELQELHLAHKHFRSGKNVRAAYRINAIILLGSGWSLAEVSEALLFDQDSLSEYVKKYKAGSIQGLVETYYRGGMARASAEQITLLCQELDNKIYLTTKAICAFVAVQFKIIYSLTGMNHLLHRLGYVYKKPKLVPGNPNIEAQDDFLSHFINFISKKPKNEKIFFVDAVHAVHNVQSTYGWIKKGIEKVIQSNTGRSRLNIHGAMDAETYEVITVSGEANVNDDSTIELLQYLLLLYPTIKKIHVILDNAKYHYSKKVQAFIQGSRINLVFLPTYSPELNLIERLWRVFKKNVLANRYYETFKQFQSACLGFFKNQAQYLDEIRSIMGEGLPALCD